MEWGWEVLLVLRFLRCVGWWFSWFSWFFDFPMFLNFECVPHVALVVVSIIQCLGLLNRCYVDFWWWVRGSALRFQRQKTVSQDFVQMRSAGGRLPGERDPSESFYSIWWIHCLCVLLVFIIFGGVHKILCIVVIHFFGAQHVCIAFISCMRRFAK